MCVENSLDLLLCTFLVIKNEACRFIFSLLISKKLRHKLFYLLADSRKVNEVTRKIPVLVPQLDFTLQTRIIDACC